jgi:hypothetical protein
MVMRSIRVAPSWLYNEIAPSQPLRRVPPEVLERYPRVPNDRTLIEELPSSRVLIVIAGIRFWISPSEYERLNLWGVERIEVHEGLLGVLPYGGLYRKRLDHSSHLAAQLMRAREKHRLDARAFTLDVLSGIAGTLIIKAL